MLLRDRQKREGQTKWYRCSPAVVGGARMALFMWRRKRSRVSQVSLLITVLTLATD